MGKALWVLSSSLVVLASALNTLLYSSSSPPIVNYDSEVYFPHDNLRAPTTKEEIVEIVKFAAENGRKIRVVGSGHSYSAIARSEDITLSLHRFSGLVRLDREAKRITVRGGTKLREVNRILEENGLAMTNLPTISAQTVAGAISTGTHGTGVKYGSLSTMVSKLELVSGMGEILSLTADGTPDRFKAAQVSLGLLGVITEVTFQCEDAFNLEETLVINSLDDCLERMSEIAHSADHAKLLVHPHSDRCLVILPNRTSEEPRDQPHFVILVLNTIIYEVLIGLLSWLPSITPYITHNIATFGYHGDSHNFVDVSHKVLSIPHYFPSHHEAEYMVEMKDCVKAMKELKRVVSELKVPVNHLSEIRFVRSDDIWLSPYYRRDTCLISQTMCNPSESMKLMYYRQFYQTMKNLNARVHWGKIFDLSPAEVREMYPRLEDFAKVRRELDPNNVFLSALLEKTFGFLA